MELETLLKGLTAGQITGGATLLVLFLMSMIQISPIKINPWSKLAQSLGRAINGEVLKEVDDLKKKFCEFEENAGERDAKAARARILRFGDECMLDTEHSKEHFDEIMRDIKEYEDYCDTHPNFENNQAIHTIQVINEIYHDRLRDHRFLWPKTERRES